MPVLGVDIGGTKTAAGVVDSSARVLRSVTNPTRAAEGFEISLAQVVATVGELFTPEISAIGICAPGPLNPKTGVVLNPPSGDAARKFRNGAEVGNVGINIGVGAPMAFFSFSGARESVFGDLHAQGRDAVRFYTQGKVVVARWPKEWSRKF